MDQGHPHRPDNLVGETDITQSLRKIYKQKYMQRIKSSMLYDRIHWGTQIRNGSGVREGGQGESQMASLKM